MALHQEDIPSINFLPSANLMRTPDADSTGKTGRPESMEL
jgi:hypothetical protein